MEERSDVLAQARVGIARLGAVLLLGMALVLAPTAAASLTGTDVVVPTSASAGGAYGSYWMTTLWVTNGSMAPTDVEMAFLERDVSNTAPVLYRVTMAPGESRSWEDAVKTLFGKTGTAGAIRLRSTNDVLVVSRTYNDAGGDISNSVGTSLEAVPAGMGAGIGRTTTFLGVTPDGSGVFRYNFGLVEVDGKAVTLRIVLRDVAGSLLGSVEAPVRALEMKQYAVSDLFPGATAPTAAVDVTVTAGNGRVVGFSTLIPNGSNSPTGFGMSLDTQSFIGPQGIAGPQGPAGATGQQGIQGVDGAQGPAGPMGAQGAHGLKGDTGTQGSAGSIGPQGPGGSTGAAGTAGATGPQGIQGPIGSTGPQGTAGIAGQTIIANKAVLNGNADPTTGQGIVGDYYVNTQTNYVFGPKTSEGWPAAGVNMVGPIGPTGLQGPVGTQGIQGSAGAAGQTGPQGPTGAQGAQGIAGQTVIADRAALNGAADPTTQGVDGDYYVNTATNVLFGPKAGSTWPKVGVNMVGPQGPAGATGPQGIQGVVGAQGSKGDTGVQGVAGSTGPQGSAGVAGAAGTAGAAGAQGIQGPTGSTGPQGTAGVAGQTVIAGKAVLSGSVDPSTSQGSDGDYYVNTATNFLFGPKSGTWPTAGVNMIGPIGPTGLQGAVGPQGVAGSTGAAGQTGPQGATGAQGPQGIAGQTVIADRAALNGAADPTTQGVDGDYYVNTATNVLFGPKSGSTWPTVGVNMVGPQGPQGVAGAQGPTGPQGSAGATGQQGIQGVTGSQGATGARGETGTSPFTLNGVDAVYTAGSLGVGVSPPNAAAALDVASTTKGFLPPRMTRDQRVAIANPVAGLQVYQTDTQTGSSPGLYQYSGSAWSHVGSVTDVTGTAPVVSSGGSTPAISMPAAASGVPGYLTADDWATFNGKAPVASPTFTGTVTAPAFAGALTGNVTGNVTGNLTGNVTGNVSGTAGGLSSTLAVTSGGTGATGAAGARTNLVAAKSGDNTDVTSLTGLDKQNALQLGPYGESAGNTGELRFLELAGTGTNYVALKAPDALAADTVYTLPAAYGSNGQILSTNASGVLSWTSASVGTVTNVAALTLGTTGTDLASSVATSTSTPVITLNVPTASSSNRGALSAADWSTFNGKQSALSGTGFVKSTAGAISYDTSAYLTTAGIAADSAKLGGVVAASYALLSSPSFTTPSLGVATGTSFNSITGLASVAPPMDGTAAVGTSTLTARQDHVHPTDTTKENALTFSSPLSRATNTISLGTVGVASGGTGATTAPAALSALGGAAKGANSDITSLSNLTTALTTAQGGTGLAASGSSGNVLTSDGSKWVSQAAGGGSPWTTGTDIKNSNSGYVEIARNLVLPYSSSGAVSAVQVRSGVETTVPFLHAYNPYPNGVAGWNIFLGYNAGNFSMTTNASGNVGIGANALSALVGTNSGEGSLNVAVGTEALKSLASGYHNIALGGSALYANTAGTDNIAIGYMAGRYTTGSGNIRIGYVGSSPETESNVIRIGTTTHAKTFLAGVRGVTPDVASPQTVVIDSNGQLGSVASSGSGVTSVSGTANKITVTGTTTPVVDIDAAYAGQTSITTLGTVGTGTWNGAAVGVSHGGTGATSLTGVLHGNGTTAVTAGNVALASEVSGTLPVANGGTGVATLTGYAKGSGTSAMSAVATIPVTDGGTGTTTAPTPNGVIYASSATGYASTAAGTTGQILKATTGGAPTWVDASGGGTVTSVAALTLGTTGSDLSSSVANGTSAPVITLNVPTASGSNRGALSSTDWTTFNNKATSGANSNITSLTGLTTALSAPQGGTGQTTFAAGDILYASAVNTLAKLTKGTDGYVLTLASGLPSWAAAGGGGGGSLYTDTTNTSAGVGALPTKATRNTAIGAGALAAITTGIDNTALGSTAGSAITTGGSNTAIGSGASILATGYSSVAIGASSNATGTQVIAIGTSATGVGDQSIAIGVSAQVNAAPGLAAATKSIAIGYNAQTLGNNSMALGNGAFVGIHNASEPWWTAIDNKVRIGNTAVTVIEGQVAWSYPSDRRLKQDIVDSPLGLAFIQKLRPVTYAFTTQPTVIHEGLIAQEVEAAAQSLGTTFHGLNVPPTPDGHYSLAYSDLVMPLINAAKELKAENDALRARLDAAKGVSEAQEAEIDALKAQMAAVLSALGKAGSAQ